MRALPVTIGGTTHLATREAGEPDHYTEAKPDAASWVGDHSAWYRWTAPAGAPITVTADVCVGAIDSIVAVYTGSAVTSLTSIVNNNDNCGGGWDAKVHFTTVPGTVYHIAVADAGGARENTFTLKLY